jgi:hypothetical protein
VQEKTAGVNRRLRGIAGWGLRPLESRRLVTAHTAAQGGWHIWGAYWKRKSRLKTMRAF